MLHKALMDLRLLETCQIQSKLTNFPQPGTKLLVVVEHACELIAMIQYTHQSE